MAIGNKGKLRVGTSGYQYDHWREVFYPLDIPKKNWLAFYAGQFDTVEINSTFYGLPATKTVGAWRKQTPEGFCYALKFSRYGSHIKRLKTPRATIQRFLQRAQRLGVYLGPILVQLPPRWNVDRERLAQFLKAAPRTIRWAVEFRDPSWLCEEVFAELQRHNAALCLHDLIQDHPARITADWTYWRFHGNRYGGSYSVPFLKARAVDIRKHLAAGIDVYVYFNNDTEGYAVQNAADLKQYVAG